MHIDRLFASLSVIGVCALLTFQPSWAWAESAEVRQPTHQEASDCAAAFEGRILQRRTEARTDARNQAILRDAELGFTFVAVAYKQGLRNPEADQMLKASEKRWAALTEAERRKRLAQCGTWAQQLFDDFNGFESYLVRNRAQARVDRLLKKETAAVSARPGGVKGAASAVAPASQASSAALPPSAPVLPVPSSAPAPASSSASASDGAPGWSPTSVDHSPEAPASDAH